ncbi:hypothetical protein [Ferrimonas marina]|uniref:Uncharacterized protein n=1 Tax=Ferrimonas marina TaxID=299255 RepID=A0A1M5X4M2_9GAMM|nr:hypothetical protein [Ferrimonas marina]SHH94766.1 hypothetical protein SAMN02745129_3223 [Ferrimonas marina]
MSFGTFLTVIVPYLFIFFVLFIGLPYLVSALVVGGYEFLKGEEKEKATNTVSNTAEMAKS